ncbi:MAG: chromosomal replication initiator protein DnaA [Bacteroidales bacterium]|nr:chromosomal replication initiator protein DnaA [Bacteroidales bacterium]
MQNTDKNKLKKVWDECLKILTDIIPKEEFAVWFSDITAVKYEDNFLYLEVPTSYYYEYIEAHYIDELGRTIRRVFGSSTQLRYMIRITDANLMTMNSVNHSVVENAPQQAPVILNNPDIKELPNPFIIPGIKPIKVESQLKENYTFENFIEGSCNKFARSAGYAVAQNPGKTAFNPLLIYSPVGLGKTHLVHAIGIEIKKLHPEKTVLYIGADQFIRQYVKSVQDNTTNDFLQFYQMMIDVLIIDDIQYLEKKQGTQDIFFQIFNWLHSLGKQLIITSDKAPADMVGFEERVLSRLKWGLNAELQIPDVQTRIDIIKKKIENDGNISMPDEVIEYLAYSVNTSIRELEGALVSVMAHATLSKQDITIDLAREIVDKFVKSNTREITIEYIQKMVCNYFNISMEQMLSRSRKGDIVTARHISMYLARKLTKSSLVAIGDKCGKKDHATVLHACKSVENSCQIDKNYRKNVEDIEKKIIN